MANTLIENYKELLYAIFNVDTNKPKRGSNSFICVYDTKDSDKLVAIFNSSKSCAEFFNTSNRSIDSSVCRGELRYKRYRLERVKEDG